MHELDVEVSGLLRDLVDFLECLGDVELPDNQRSARESLLQRSRSALERSSSLSLESPEPYLDMSAGKSMLSFTGGDDETDHHETLQEYVNADNRQSQRVSLQHYYETFQDFRSDEASDKFNGKLRNDKDKELDDVILLYASFSAVQAKHKAVKSGTLLHLKRERKMFAPFNVFWLNRQCWVSLVGSHLLLYGNDRDSRPYLVAPLRGYKGRPAPGALARDSRRSEAAFEMYCPGERTFQFAAKSVEEMREWLDAIAESLEPETKKTRAATFGEILELESNERMCIERVKEEKEKYQDVIGLPKSKTKEKSSNGTKITTTEKEKSDESKEDAPPLPARTRRLPSLPSQEQVAYEPREELYDEEGLYHRIEDIKAQREYQNCQLLAKENERTSMELLQDAYDDTEVFVEINGNQEPSETYDDVQSVINRKEEEDEGGQMETYDDVQPTTNDSSIKDKLSLTTTTSKSTKPAQKRSFLDRVRNRKESIKKDDNKPKSPTITSPIVVSSPDLPCYDQVSSPVPSQSDVNEEEYLSPPPPRPIYSRPPTIIKCAVQDDIYDDIGGCRGCANVDVIKDYPKNGSFLSDLQLSIDREHYQVPKSGNRKVAEYTEELYDDVTLSETFKNRQRESPAVQPEKSVWSRFGSGKRPRIFDHLSRQTSNNESTEANEGNGGEQQQQTKVKSLQKLINKMENTLGKASKPNGLASQS